MKINLRKANALRSKLERTLNEFTLPDSFQLSLLREDHTNDPSGVLQQQIDEIRERLNDMDRLSTILSNMRTAISVENTKKGIDTILSELSHLDRQSKLISLFGARRGGGVDVETAPAAVTKAMKEYNAPSTDRFHTPSATLTVNLLTPELRQELNTRVIELRRKREEMHDKLLAENVQHTITIPDEDYAFLEERAVI